MYGEQKISIKELDLNMISPASLSDYNSSKLVIIGKPGTGKTFLIKSLLYNKHTIIPTGIVMSGTEDSNAAYSEIFPPIFIFNGMDTNKIEQFIRRQKVSMQNIPENPWSLLLLDDCADDPKILRTPLFQDIFKNGRHWKMLFILSLQYALDIPPSVRTNVDGVFILRENNLRNRKVLYENYAGIIPDFKLFCDIMDQLTNNYTALYINNTGTSTDWRDCVFWYKAKPVPDGFKFGCPDYWGFANTRYNHDYKPDYLI